MKSPSSHQFSQVPRVEIPRSVFLRNCGYKTTFDAGYLIPWYVDEALPGDTFNLRATLFARLATPLYPIMDNLYMDVHYFAVPLRLVWDNFVHFMGEKTDPDDETEYTTPKIVSPVSTGWVVGSLQDYMGLPTGVASLSVAAFWTRAYNLIYNEWYRDQNLIDHVKVDKDNGPDASTDYVLLKRGKRHDYFTSALPWPQKGDAVSLPLGETAPVVGIGKFTNVWSSGSINVYETGKSGVTNYPAGREGITGVVNDNLWIVKEDGTTGHPDIRADLSEATAATINSLREAFQLQRLLERDARGGSRYTEIVRAHYGIVSQDQRLQRPEYLGGTTAPVRITPVAQTSKTESGAPTGKLAGFGTLTVNNAGFTKSFTEHCVILGILSVRADLTYQQGLHRMWSRDTRYDFYFPVLAHLGEQTILQKEIFCDGNSSHDNLPFGYQERWAEYRYKPSQITGKLRSTYSTPLDAWHLAQEFDTAPTLSQTFIEETPPMSRIKAVNTEPDFILDAYVECKTARPMPVYSVPGLIDHF